MYKCANVPIAWCICVCTATCVCLCHSQSGDRPLMFTLLKPRGCGTACQTAAAGTVCVWSCRLYWHTVRCQYPGCRETLSAQPAVASCTRGQHSSHTRRWCIQSGVCLCRRLVGSFIHSRSQTWFLQDVTKLQDLCLESSQAWSLAKHVDNSQISRPSPDFILMMDDVSERGHCHTSIIQLLHMAKKTKLRAKNWSGFVRNRSHLSLYISFSRISISN